MMKAVYSLIFLFLFVSGISSQTLTSSSAVSPVVVIKKDWSVSKRENINSRPLLDTDPFAPIIETTQAQRDYEYRVQQQKQKTRQGLPTEPQTTRVFPTKPANTTNPVSLMMYSYKAKVKNTGSKVIKTVTWEYVFYNPTTKEEVGRRQFISNTNISPNETDILSVETGLPPAATVNASQAGKKLRENYFEEIVIKSVEFADGTVWKTP